MAAALFLGLLLSSGCRAAPEHSPGSGAGQCGGNQCDVEVDDQALAQLRSLKTIRSHGTSAITIGMQNASSLKSSDVWCNPDPVENQRCPGGYPCPQCGQASCECIPPSPSPAPTPTPTLQPTPQPTRPPTSAPPVNAWCNPDPAENQRCPGGYPCPQCGQASCECIPPSPSPAPASTPAPAPTPTPRPAHACTAQPNPPEWGANVHVFTPADPDIESVVQSAYALNGGQDPPNNGHFSDKRFAFLFQPGTYSVDVPVGFYTSVAGLGVSPDDVVFSGSKGVYSEEGAESFQIGALDTFWRSAENFKTLASFEWWNGAAPGMLWAVSQAAPLRRVHVEKDLWLAQYQAGDAAGYASGGFLANSVVGGSVQFMSQQQFMNRNVQMQGASGGAWSFVFVGCMGGVPAANCGTAPSVTVEPSAPKIAEKPFIVSDGTTFTLHVPVVKTNTQGASWANGGPDDDVVIDFSDVYVAKESDNAAAINSAIACENVKALVLTPGHYYLEEAIHITKADFVVLGLGFPTLIPTAGTPAISVNGGIGGVRVASVLLQAGKERSPALLLWGDGSGADVPPSVMSDIFARNGGPSMDLDTSVDTFVHIKSNNVIGDNLWLWRADHTVAGTTTLNTQVPTDHGIIVDGDNVIMYGLMCEHTLKTLTVWNGEAGQVYFYQSELPYDGTEESFGKPGYNGYSVSEGVKTHTAKGIGVYTNFFNDVTVASAVTTPDVGGFSAVLGVHLNNIGQVEHVINDLGAEISEANGNGIPSYVCSP